MGASLLAVLVVSVLLAAAARRFDVSAPLALVVAGLAIGLIPGFKEIELDPRARAVRATAAAVVVGRS
jgi:monovalent cation/hydrogen antiporter